MDESEVLSVTVHGSIRKTEFPEEQNTCVKMQAVTSGDWKITSGDSVILSAFCFRSSDNNTFIDLPFEISLNGTSPYSWPKLVFNCFSKDSTGKDGVIGYGALSIPTEPGKHLCRVYCFVPKASSAMQWIIAKLRGLNAELVDPLLPANAEGRYACQTITKGFLDVELNINIKAPDTNYRFSSSSSEAKTNTKFPSSIVELAEMKLADIQETRFSHITTDDLEYKENAKQN